MARNYDDNKKGNDSHRDGRHGGKPSRRHQTVTTVTSGQLPKWVRDEIMRSTPNIAGVRVVLPRARLVSYVRTG